MSFADVPRRGLSPLWMIALFLSFSETVLGIAVVQTSGGIQIALTCFVIAFPLVVSALFFLILWKRPYVFYPPGEFSAEVDVRTYVEAMQSPVRSPQATPVSEAAIRNIEAKMMTISAELEKTKDPKQQAALILKGTVDAVKESVVRIDAHPMFGYEGRVWEEPFDPEMAVRDFLDSLYFELKAWGVRPFTYGKVWAIRNMETGETLLSAGRDWARRNGMSDDQRAIGQLGLKGGVTLEIVPVGPFTFSSRRPRAAGSQTWIS
jgi:hypothetical protein